MLSCVGVDGLYACWICSYNVYCISYHGSVLATSSWCTLCFSSFTPTSHTAYFHLDLGHHVGYFLCLFDHLVHITHSPASLVPGSSPGTRLLPCYVRYYTFLLPLYFGHFMSAPPLYQYIYSYFVYSYGPTQMSIWLLPDARLVPFCLFPSCLLPSCLLPFRLLPFCLLCIEWWHFAYSAKNSFLVLRQAQTELASSTFKEHGCWAIIYELPEKACIRIYRYQ